MRRTVSLCFLRGKVSFYISVPHQKWITWGKKVSLPYLEYNNMGCLTRWYTQLGFFVDCPILGQTHINRSIKHHWQTLFCAIGMKQIQILHDITGQKNTQIHFFHSHLLGGFNLGMSVRSPLNSVRDRKRCVFYGPPRACATGLRAQRSAWLTLNTLEKPICLL